MKKPLESGFRTSLSAGCRTGNHAIRALTFFCSLVPLSVSAADACNTLSTRTEGKPGAFEQRLQSLETGDDLDREIRNSLCTKDSVFAFLTDEPAYHYGSCFVAAGDVDRFWNADHQQAQAMLIRFRSNCIAWAEKRYRPLMAQIEANARTRAERQRAQAFQQRAEQERAKALAEAKHRAEHMAQHESSRQQALQQALKTVRSRHNVSILQWSAERIAPTQQSNELAAWLLATDLSATRGETPPTPRHLQQHLNALLGKPRVEAVTATGNAQEYRVRIQSGHNNFTMDAFIETNHPPAGDIMPWVLFERRERQLTPVAAVLQTPEQVLTATRLESRGLPLKPLPDRNITRLPVSAGAVHIQLRCVPHDGGQPMPLGRCLKPDGEINVLTPNKSERHVYTTFHRQQREYQAEIKSPYALLVRTGDANRRGELQLKVIDTTQTDKPALFDSRAIARRDNLFVYSE